MNRLLIQFLGYLSLICCFVSCSTPGQLLPLKNGQKVTLSANNFKPPFQDNFKSMLFKTNLSYGKKFDFGGLLALKQIKTGNYRAIFMTMAGSTLFDFEFGTQGLVVHKLLKAMDRKILLKIIEKDFEMLLANNLQGKEAFLYSKGERQVIKTKLHNKACYFVQQNDRQVLEVHQAKNVTVRFSELTHKVPNLIRIQHHNLPLTLQLKLLKS